MKKILILGAGNAQMDLIQYCQESGMEVHCCSYSETDPGAFTADHFANINILDCDRIEQYFLDHKIDVIYSIGSDIAVPVFSRTVIGVDDDRIFDMLIGDEIFLYLRRILLNKVACNIDDFL